MNVSNIAALATDMSSARTEQAVGIAVLKKALDIESASAAVLLDALPPTVSTNLPDNLGRNINTTA
ncbi:MAG: YjfB family protein [Herminiimonas sp.]|nr:YjfB family protein [Herminiimonas sp.]